MSWDESLCRNCKRQSRRESQASKVPNTPTGDHKFHWNEQVFLRQWSFCWKVKVQIINQPCHLIEYSLTRSQLFCCLQRQPLSLWKMLKRKIPGKWWKRISDSSSKASKREVKRRRIEAQQRCTKSKEYTAIDKSLLAMWSSAMIQLTLSLYGPKLSKKSRFFQMFSQVRWSFDGTFNMLFSLKCFIAILKECITVK